MSKTPGERGIELVSLLRFDGCWKEWTDTELTAAIAQAIRQAENSKLEEAALHFEGQAPAIQSAVTGMSPVPIVAENLVEIFAKGIPADLRSLKHKDT